MTQEGEDANAPVDKAAVAARWHKGIRIPLSYLVASHDFVKEMAKRAPLPGKTTGAMPIAMGEYTPKEGDGEGHSFQVLLPRDLVDAGG